jgi:hypothetical protein
MLEAKKVALVDVTKESRGKNEALLECWGGKGCSERFTWEYKDCPHEKEKTLSRAAITLDSHSQL